MSINTIFETELVDIKFINLTDANIEEHERIHREYWEFKARNPKVKFDRKPDWKCKLPGCQKMNSETAKSCYMCGNSK